MLKKKNEVPNNFQINLSKQREEEKLNNLKIEHEIVKRDVDYVKFLDDWEKTCMLPIIDSKK